MTSKIRKLFNFISILLLLWTIISGIYLALPPEYKALIPEFNWLTAVVSGGSTGVLGSTILFVDRQLKKQDSNNSNKYLELAQEFLKIREDNVNLRKELSEDRKELKEVKELLSETNRLVRVDLESKLSNPLIEEFIKEKMRGEGIGKKEPEDEEINI